MPARITQRDSQKEPKKKDSCGCRNDCRKCERWQMMRMAVQEHKTRKRRMFRKKIVRPMWWRPGLLLLLVAGLESVERGWGKRKKGTVPWN
jgi:hypothetical protein